MYGMSVPGEAKTYGEAISPPHFSHQLINFIVMVDEQLLLDLNQKITPQPWMA